MSAAASLLVVAKAPIPGQAKSRVAATVGDETAAQLAAAALLDTLEVAEGLGWPVVVAITGDLHDGAR
ncbi:MAG: glycosyltransferase, partial [Nesterenkonia sp.]|nr:glycosyltransferase [Nesterenkonia sp.]